MSKRGGGTCLNAHVRAFTLAEVLITLAIIGIVAALTLPNLIANHQKKVLAVQAKKAYSIMTQAFSTAVYKYGEPENWEASFSNPYNTYFDDFIYPELKGFRCQDNASLKKRSYDYVSKLSEYGVRNGGYIASSGRNCFMTADNQLIVPSVRQRGSGTHSSTSYTYSTEEFLIDVNGFEKPNRYGKDIFAFFIVTIANNFHVLSVGGYAGQIMAAEKPGIYPAGYQGYTGSNCKTEIDWTCPYKLMQDGWEFKDDYPW